MSDLIVPTQSSSIMIWVFFFVCLFAIAAADKTSHAFLDSFPFLTCQYFLTVSASRSLHSPSPPPLSCIRPSSQISCQAAGKT